jgi:hypothetical protein
MEIRHFFRRRACGYKVDKLKIDWIERGRIEGSPVPLPSIAQ